MGVHLDAAYCTVRIQYIICIICKIRVNQLSMVSVRPSSQLEAISKVWGGQKLCAHFQLARGSAPLTSLLFKGQL